MIELHYYPGNASLFPHMLLRELGVPFDLRLVDRRVDAQNSAAYLALNPAGKIPVLVHDGRAITETVAIGLYLADAYPAAGLAPPPGSPERGDYYKWMAQIANTLQAEFRAWFYPHEFTTDPDGAEAVKTAVGRRLTAAFERIADQLGERPWLLESGVSAADLYLWLMIRWGRTLPTPAREIGALGALAERVQTRPAARAALEIEGLEAPFV
ncbi:glutathione S-transferase family protein [Phenylobacterium sp.]|uniref:glutathione S-transferase family protein n=1 Tax=Phenylobacterium sp. TaxID=1871053 RepID=UPI0035B03445